MSPVVFVLHGHEALCRIIAERLGGELGKLTLRRFPDSETYLRQDKRFQPGETDRSRTE